MYIRVTQTYYDLTMNREVMPETVMHVSAERGALVISRGYAEEVLVMTKQELTDIVAKNVADAVKDTHTETAQNGSVAGLPDEVDNNAPKPVKRKRATKTME